MAATDVALANRALAMTGQGLLSAALSENEVLNAVYASERDAVLSMHPWRFAVKRDRITAAGLLDCSSKTITFVDSDPDTITDSGSGFVTGNFVVGDIANIAGSGSNDAAYNVDSVAAGTLTLESSEEVSAEVLTNDSDLKIFALSNDGRYKFPKPSDCLRILTANEINVWNEPYNWEREGKFLLSESIDENDQLRISYISQVTDPTLFDPGFEECFVIKLCAVLSMGDKENPEQAQMWNKHFDYRFKQHTTRNANENKRNRNERRLSGWQRAGKNILPETFSGGRYHSH